MSLWECHFRKTEGGFTVEFAGDPERMRVRQEALHDLAEMGRRFRESELRPSRLLKRIVFGQRS